MACASTSSASRSNKESLEDCMCTICLCILVHPVTLPCGHELCMPCFKQNVEESSLTCPLCRTRISTWARKATRTNSLVDQKRWAQIQRLFPQRVQRRLDGLDDDTDEEIKEKEDVDVSYRHMIQLSEPGEIRREYEEELKRLEAQQAAEQREAEEASISLIRRLRSQEEQRLLETRRQQEEIVARDSQLAQELGKLINTVGSETPVNRLLQDSTLHYPNLPHLPPSTTPITTSLSSQDNGGNGNNQKGKAVTMTKQNHNNKTLETFFRRLPASGKRTARSSSEPQIGGAGGGKNGVGIVVSPRCQSVPVRGKENLPIGTDVSPLHGTASEDVSFYEDPTPTSSAYAAQQTNPVDCTAHSSRGEEGEEMRAVTIQKVKLEAAEAGRGALVEDRLEVICVGSRSQSATTVHSDGSESVIICESKTNIGGRAREEEEEEDFEGDPHFRPIPGDPNITTHRHPVPVEPCVVRITPRMLFSTDHVSTTTFPILPSPTVSSTVSGNASLKGDRTGPIHGCDKRTGDGVNCDHTEALKNRTEKDSVWCNLRLERDRKREGRSDTAVHANHNLRSHRAKSASPTAVGKMSPRRRLVIGDSADRIPYCRPSLREFRSSGKLQALLVEEAVSDSELSSPSHYRLRPGHYAAGRRLLTLERGRKEKKKDCMSDSENEDNHCRGIESSHTTGQTGMADKAGCNADPKDVCFASSGVGRKAKTVPLNRRDSLSVDFQPSTSSEEEGDYTSYQQSLSLSRPSNFPSLLEDMDSSGVVSGKGKRLMKRSAKGSLSLRNFPKNSSKLRTSEQEEGVEVVKGKAVECSEVPQHTGSFSYTEQSSLGVQQRILAETVAESVKPTSRGITHPHQNNDSERLLRRVSRPDKYCKKSRMPPSSSTSQSSFSILGTNTDGENTDESFERAGKAERKTLKHASAEQTCEVSGVRQRSIKHWFASNPPALQKNTLENLSESNMSENTDIYSGQSSTVSSATSSPYKTGMRASQRARKVNPKLDDFLLTVTKKLTQFRSDSDPTQSPSKMISTPIPSPVATTPTRPLKRKGKVTDSDSDCTPVKKGRKPSPQKVQVSRIEDSGKGLSLSSQQEKEHREDVSSRVGHIPHKQNLQNTGHTPQKQTSYKTGGHTSQKQKVQKTVHTPKKQTQVIEQTGHTSQTQGIQKIAHTSQKQKQIVEKTGHKPKKQTVTKTDPTPLEQTSHRTEMDELPSDGGEDEEEEEEGLSQEERDRRLALRLQEQFDLADKLNLKVVRFKGTHDQYALRRGHSNTHQK